MMFKNVTVYIKKKGKSKNKNNVKIKKASFWT